MDLNIIKKIDLYDTDDEDFSQNTKYFSELEEKQFYKIYEDHINYFDEQNITPFLRKVNHEEPDSDTEKRFIKIRYCNKREVYDVEKNELSEEDYQPSERIIRECLENI